jgi:DNA-binding NtrC family response regulator
MLIHILEDDIGVGGVYLAALQLDGHEVRVFSSFQEARRALRESPPDALITDVRVGSYNGLQLALMFREVAPDKPIVVVSGHDDPVIRNDAERLHAAFYVKPISLDVLRSQFAM